MPRQPGIITTPRAISGHDFFSIAGMTLMLAAGEQIIAGLRYSAFSLAGARCRRLRIPISQRMRAKTNAVDTTRLLVSGSRLFRGRQFLRRRFATIFIFAAGLRAIQENRNVFDIRPQELGTHDDGADVRMFSPFMRAI